jgi:general secretion pathway protein E
MRLSDVETIQRDTFAGSGAAFARYLVETHGLVADVLAEPDNACFLKKLWEQTGLSAGDFADRVSTFYGLPRAHLSQLLSASALVEQFSPRFLRAMDAFPYRDDADTLRLAVGDPSDTASVRAAEIVLGGPVTVEVASFEDISTALTEKIGRDETALVVGAGAPAARNDDDIENLRDLASGAPVVRAVNDLLEKAMELRASDIHVEPFRAGLVIRMRIDGLLRTIPAPTDALPQALISRIKILAGLNIAERRLPQDGAARLRVARTDLDIRVAIMPTQHGESAVIRLLPNDRTLMTIDRLGLSGTDQVKLLSLLALPHGMIVVTGPTGSGKTTTLATILSALNDSTRKILTVEDPVEYEIHGITQSQVRPSIGLTFASALRAFVRQDPDVIMVGEIRDAETAHIAIHAALTGHLVLTTLHTETAAGGAPPARPRCRELPTQVDTARRDRATPGAAPLRALQDAADSRPCRCWRGSVLCGARAQAGRNSARSGGMRTLRRHRLPRPRWRVRNSRSDGSPSRPHGD